MKERHAALRKEAEEKRKHTVEHRERFVTIVINKLNKKNVGFFFKISENPPPELVYFSS